MGALVHETIRGDGDNQNIAKALGLLEITDMANVDQVEYTMTMNDFLALTHDIQLFR